MIVLLLSIASFVLYLAFERIRLDRWRRSIPQVIVVTGTRGKSSVVRMLASVLRADGRGVLAKTTGSSPRLLWPDGTESEIKRRGAASILEQTELLKQAANQNVDCLVAEVMSIHRDNHYVESRQILKPDLVVVTNTWPDHIGAAGKSEAEIAATLRLDIPNGATVFIPADSNHPVFEETVRSVSGELVVFGDEASLATTIHTKVSEGVSFTENFDLVLGIARHLGIDDAAISVGITPTSNDVGATSIRTIQAGCPKKRLVLVNAFAANDPKSTFRVLVKAKAAIPNASSIVGLICLRSDRADRTEQWLETLKNEPSLPFSKLYVTGGHANIVARKLAIARQLGRGSASEMVEEIANEVEGDSLIFGFGNFVGIGSQLVEHWNREGEAYGV